MPKPQKYRDVIKVVEANGWIRLRQGKGSHEIWGLPDESRAHSIPRHHEVSAGVVGGLMRKLRDVPQNW